MPELLLHNKPIHSVFQLLGEKENDITYSLGWALSRSPSFLRKFLKKIVTCKGDVSAATIRLQHYQRDKGITDIEIELVNHFYIIVEAKRGWNLPSGKQLKTYAPRFPKKGYPDRKIIVLSECTREYAGHYLPYQKVRGIPVEPESWKAVIGVAGEAAMVGNHAEKRLLQEFISYLRRVTTMQDIDSNWVYVVSLGSGTNKGWRISWIDIVNKRKRYFHRMGVNGWPKEPPNYLGFRYKGKLQSIHHVESCEVVTDLHDRFPEIPSKNRPPTFVYKLGPAIVPPLEVRTGNLYANGRVWCMLDTLLTCDTISQSRDLSKKRSNLAKKHG